jgi:2-hydroxychromene-2-carboxylate isomerase
VDNVDVADAAALARVLDAAGVDGAAVLAAADGAEVKAVLKANTDRAMAAGVCGVPSYQVDEGTVVWGQDRLDVVADILCGWDADADDKAPAAKL